MNTSQQRRDFRLLIHESEGKAFEDLFIKIMQYANTNFIPVKPHGSDGDRKNDGFDPTKGIYFQVYAPEDVRKSPYRTIEKLHKDFEGLQAHWNQLVPIQEFFFVINDKYKGVYPKIYTRLKRIERRYGLKKSELFLAQHLESALFVLSPDVFEVILNSNKAEKLLESNIKSHSEYIIDSQSSFTSNNHVDALVLELVQKNRNRIATPSDLCIYAPIIKKYGITKGTIIIERSLKAGRREI